MSGCAYYCTNCTRRVSEFELSESVSPDFPELEQCGSATICKSCGKPIRIGDYPFCPHGKANFAVADDTLTGGARWMHNLGDKPVWVETKTQLNKELASRGLRIADRGTHNKQDSSPYATKSRLKPGRVDPFLSGDA